MRNYVLIIVLLLFVSCKEKNHNEIILPKTYKGVSVFNEVVFYNNKKINGTLFLLDSNTNDTLLLEKYKNGLLDGVSKKWYPNHQLMEYREYKFGKKNGKQIAFWQNGNKRFEFVAKNDAYDGEMKEWSVNAKLFHLAHYLNGQEEGSQKMWYENGKVRANYVILNGKRYGLLGTKNCKNVSDSIFVFK